MKYKISEARGGKNRSTINKIKDRIDDSGLTTTKKLQAQITNLIVLAIVLFLAWIPLYAAWLIIRMFISN